MSEHTEQTVVIQWARMMSIQYPALDLLFAIPNGAPMTFTAARRMKAEGMTAGVPDLCLPVARQGYHGLFIELKVGRNKPSEKQTAWLDRLHAEGYQALVCYGAQEAIDALSEYIGNETENERTI